MRFMESTPLAESQVELGSHLTSLCGDAANPLRSEGFQPKPTPISVVKEPIQSPGIHLSAAGFTGPPVQTGLTMPKRPSDTSRTPSRLSVYRLSCLSLCNQPRRNGENLIRRKTSVPTKRPHEG